MRHREALNRSGWPHHDVPYHVVDCRWANRQIMQRTSNLLGRTGRPSQSTCTGRLDDGDPFLSQLTHFSLNACVSHTFGTFSTACTRLRR